MKKAVIAVVAIVLVLGAVLGVYLYQKSKTPDIEITETDFDKLIYDSLTAVEGEKEFYLAEMTVENATDAIRQIKSDKDFRAVFVIESFWEGASVRTENTVRKSGNKYHIDISGSENKTIICDGEKIKVTNNLRGTSDTFDADGDFTYTSQIGAADIAYFLENADNKLITARFAESVGKTSGNIIYIEFSYDKFNQLEKFYISADYGIVLAAETYIGDTLTYRLTTSEFTADYISDQSVFDIE